METPSSAAGTAASARPLIAEGGTTDDRRPQGRRGKAAPDPRLRADALTAPGAQSERIPSPQWNEQGVVMKRLPITFLALAVAGLVAGSAVAGGSTTQAPKAGSVLIQHALHGCHVWAANGSAFGVSHSLTIKAGGTVTFTNNDVMPQRLIERSGGAVLYAGNRALNKPAAQLRVTFTKPGRYVFGTKPGEDYSKGIKTIGADNLLKLVVTVL
jgi:plastocyanin